jgi:hypothetical protein
MRLTQIALESIDKQKVRLKIALALDCSEMSVRRYIESNDDNLTKAASLKVIREETGLTDQEILESEIAQEGQK